MRLEEYFDDNVLAKITMIVDSDLKKKNQEIAIKKRIYHVMNIDDIETKKENVAILVPCVDCFEIIDMLERNEKACQCDIVSLEYMIRTVDEDCAMSRKIPDNLRLTDKQKIPKIIHYCWFWGNLFLNIIKNILRAGENNLNMAEYIVIQMWN